LKKATNKNLMWKIIKKEATSVVELQKKSNSSETRMGTKFGDMRKADMQQNGKEYQKQQKNWI
jgi:hypothetical protein